MLVAFINSWLEIRHFNSLIKNMVACEHYTLIEEEEGVFKLLQSRIVHVNS
jgi:sensor histidine kinase regulating citrate/malate metabolism